MKSRAAAPNAYIEHAGFRQLRQQDPKNRFLKREKIGSQRIFPPEIACAMPPMFKA